MKKTVQTLQKDENMFHVLSTKPLPPIWTNLIIFVTPFPLVATWFMNKFSF